jgi:hypothetical protein
MADIKVRGAAMPAGWRFEVTVSDGSGRTRHEVSLDRADYERLTGGRVPSERLVQESFNFLIEREPKDAIMRSFDLMVIGRYFPEYEDEIARRLVR